MSKKKTILSYALVFAGFLAMFFFVLPTVDVFVFYRESGGENWTLSSAVESALYYGNGRFLGNLMLYLLSHHFRAAGVLVALTFLTIVFSLNALVFDNRLETIFPIALLVALPGKGMISEAYYMFASFLNYVFPVALGLLAMVVVRKSYARREKGRPSILMELLAAIMLYADCLFSENTTIALAVIAVVCIAYRFGMEKRCSAALLMQGLAVAAGVATMFLIPPMTGTAHKLDYYRSVSTTLFTLIDQGIGNYIAFATFFSTFIPVVVLLGVGFVFLVRSECTSSRWYGLLMFVFVMYPAACVGFSLLDSNLIRINWLYLAQAAMLLMFIAAILLAAVQIRDRKKKVIVFAMITAVSFTIAPMMVVSQYGYRTYYTTFAASIVLALYLIKTFAPEKLREVFTADGNTLRTGIRSCMVVFVFVSAFLLLQTMYNFAFYAVRSDDILRQAETSDVIEVPVLPCRICSMEDIYYTSITHSVGLYDARVKLIDVYTGDNSEAYVSVMQASPVTVLRIAAENFKCLDPGYFDRMLAH